MKKSILTLALLAAVSWASAQQIGLHSQYMINRYAINPAVAGSHDRTSMMLTYRNQWAGFDDAPSTATFLINGQVGDNMGLGAIFLNDETGPLRNTAIHLSYAYHLQLNDESKLGMGVTGIMNQYVLDQSRVTLDDPNDQAVDGSRQLTMAPDAAFGAYYYSEKLYVGASAPNLFQNKLRFGSDKLELNKLVRHYFLLAGYKHEINETIAIEPSVLVKATESAPSQFDLNTKVHFKHAFWLGASYRDRESLVAMFGIKKGDLSAGYSYDMTLSSIRKYSTGTHEFFLAVNVGGK